MKATVKSLLVLVLVIIGSTVAQAASPRNYIFDTKEENGKIVSKTVFLHENDLLNKEVMYEFAYNTDGKVAEKKAYKWNKKTQQWDPAFLITYDYSKEEDSIHANLAMWDKKTKTFGLGNQEVIIPATNYDSIFS